MRRWMAERLSLVARDGQQLHEAVAVMVEDFVAVATGALPRGSSSPPFVLSTGCVGLSGVLCSVVP